MDETKPCEGDAWFQGQLDSGQRNVSFDPNVEVEARTISASTLRSAICDTQKVPLVVENAVVDGAINLAYDTVAQPLQFVDCIFREQFLGVRMRFAALQFAGCDFIEGLLLRSSEIDSLNLARSNKSGRPTRVRGLVDLNGVKVLGQARLNDTRFFCDVDFIQMRVGSDIQLVGTKFLERRSTVDFSGTTTGGSIDLRSVRCRSTLRLQGVTVRGELNLSDGYFHQDVVAERARVEIGVFLSNSVFAGDLNFFGAEIDRGLLANEATLKGETIFSWSKATQLVNFRGATFLAQADFSHTDFRATVVFGGAKFGSYLNLYGMKVSGPFHVFSDPFVSRDTFMETELPRNADLRRLSYDMTDIADSDRWKSWLRLKRNSETFDFDPFLALERSLRSAGNRRVADDVRYEMGLRDGKNLWASGQHLPWVVNLLHRALVGYGVRGPRLIGWIAVTFSIGFFFFWCRNPGDFMGTLFYTFDAFLPINLGYVSSRDLTGHLARGIEIFLRLSGWVLVPLVVAQLAGFLKSHASS